MFVYQSMEGGVGRNQIKQGVSGSRRRGSSGWGYSTVRGTKGHTLLCIQLPPSSSVPAGVWGKLRAAKSCQG